MTIKKDEVIEEVVETTEEVIEEKPKKTTRGRKATTKEETKKEVKSRATINKELRAKAKDIDVEVESLVKGDVFYVSKKTGEVLEINEVGDREIISLDLLIDISKRGKKFLNKFIIGVVDVYSDDYTLEDILELLDIKDKYIFKEMSISEIDSFILDTELTEFEKEFNALKDEHLKFRLIERSVALYKEHLLDSTAKMRLFEVAYGTEYLYKNI